MYLVLNFKLLIVGDGNLMGSVKKLIKIDKLSKKIELVGWVNNPKKYYLQSKILVLPTFFESFGNVLVEAIHYKLACIATKRSGGPDEILANGKYGYLFKKESSQDLQKKIEYCIEKNNIREKKIKLATKSLKRFSISKNLNDYYKVLNRI